VGDLATNSLINLVVCLVGNLNSAGALTDRSTALLAYDNYSKAVELKTIEEKKT
jgi:hypothetical protein